MSASVAEWTRLMNQARVKLTGASDAAIKAELFDVFQEFYDHSSSWLETLMIPVLANQTTYDLVPTAGSPLRIAGVFQVDPTNPLTPQNIRGATMPNFGTLQLTEVPGADATYAVTVVLNVSLPFDKNGFPIVSDWVLQIYSTGILDGLLGRMMNTPNKSYSSPTTAAYHTREFQKTIQQARVAALRQNAFGTQAWVFPQAWRTSGQRGGVSIGSDTSFKT